MSAESAIRAGQQAAEAQMRDKCIITRTHKVTGADGDDAFEETVIYGGPQCPWKGRCKITTYEPDAIVIQSGSRPVETQEYRLHVPVSAGPFLMGDTARIDGYPRPFRIDGLFQRTFQTAQRLKITEQANKAVQ